MASATEHKTLCKEWVNRKYGVSEFPQDIEAVHQLITSVEKRYAPDLSTFWKAGLLDLEQCQELLERT